MSPILGCCAFSRPGFRFAVHRRRARDWCLIGLVAAALTSAPWAFAEGKTALLVVGSTTLNASDTALKQRLDRYYTTTVRDDGATADTTKDLIVISSSAVAGTVGTKYKSASKGVLVMQPAAFANMAMTAAGAFGTLSAQTLIKISNAGHQMAAGFTLNVLVTVYSSAQATGWGTPGTSATKVAVATDDVAGHVLIFGYEAGAAMVGFTAPARRVGYYVSAANALTASGWKLFDYAVDFADGNVPPVTGGANNAITWSSTVTRLARGCDAYSPTWTPDDHLYTSWGDCNGLKGALSSKQSMGMGRISGAPASSNVALADIDTGPAGAPDIDQADGGLDALGDGKTGKKPSGMLYVGNTLYAFVRNIKTDGTQSRIRYTQQNYNQPNSLWNWASWTFTEFGYPTFVQYGKGFAGGGDYAYVVAHDNPSAYVAANRFVLMRVPVGSILTQSAWQFFSGTATAPAWSSYAQRASRTAIFTSKGRCLRSGMTYNAARARYYWWQEIPPTWDSPDTRFFGGFGIYSAPQPWGPWQPVYYTEKWDIGPGERGEFPTKWMSTAGPSASGDMYLVFSGNDQLSIRKGTIAAGR